MIKEENRLNYLVRKELKVLGIENEFVDDNY